MPEIPISEEAGTSSLMEGQLTLPNADSFPDLLPAKPEAILPYFDVVGNPQFGSNPGKDKPSFVQSIAQDLENNTPQANPFYAMQPFTYSGDSDANNFERYHSTGDLYDKLGFSPYRDNEALYNKNISLGTEFVRAAKQWDDLVGIGFMSGVRSWETLFTDPLSPDLKGAEGMKKAMLIGSSGRGGIGGFFVNTFLNSGYTVGVGADFLAEELVLMGVGAATGGSTGGAILGKGASAISKLFSTTKKAKTELEATHAASEIIRAEQDVNNLAGIIEVGDNFNEARGFWGKIGKSTGDVLKGTADILNPLDNTVAALKATDYATNYAKVAKTFGAFADDLLMMKGAVSEAKLEGGMVKLDVSNNLIEEYRNAHDGKSPEGKDLTDIEKIANDEAYKTAFWNLPAITTSNKLMYATMLAPIRRIMGREVQELIPTIIGEGGVYTEVGESIAERARVAAKSLRKPKIYGQFGMNYLKANFAEGIQENIQEAISTGAIAEAEALYRDPIRASYEGYMPHFMKGLKAQLSAQGAETFAGGFVMGMFAQPVMAIPSVSISKLFNATLNKENIDRYKEQKKKELHGYDLEDGTHVMGTLEYLNGLARDKNGYVNLDLLAPDLANAVRTGRLANDMFSAARIGDKNGTLNSRDALQNHHLMTAIKTGKLDGILERLKDYKNLSKVEAAEAFSKYGIAPEDVDKALAQIDGVVQRAKDVQEIYHDGANRYPNPINPKDFRKDPIKYQAALATKLAWDDAVYQLVFAKATFQDYSKRVADIASTFSKISTELAGEDAQSLMSLLGSQSMMNEINMLRREIDVLDEKDSEQASRKKDKLARLEKIQAFYNTMASVKHAQNDEERAAAGANAKEAFAEYVRHLAGKKDKIIFDEGLDSAYTLIKDHLLLNHDMVGLSKTINVLMAPKSFMAIHEKMARAYNARFERLSDTLALNADQFGFMKELKTTAAEITKQTGLLVPNEVLGAAAEAFASSLPYPVPTYFLDDADAQTQITSGEKFDRAFQMWSAFVAVQKHPDTDTSATNFVAEDISTYPKDLLEQYQEIYDGLDPEYKARVPFDEYVTMPAQAALRQSYFDNLTLTGLDIPAEWANLSIEQLETVHDKLTEAAEKDPSVDPRLRKLEDVIAWRKMKESGATAQKAAALRNLQALTIAAASMPKNEQGYWVNGAYTDLRITNLIYDVILPKHYDKKSIPFSEKDSSKFIIQPAKKIFFEGNTAGLDVVDIVNKWITEVHGKPKFEIFDNDKITKIKKDLTKIAEESKDKIATFEDFKKVLNRYATKESTTAGNTVDELVRSFITYGTMVKTDMISDEAFKSLRDNLHKLMKELKDKGETILAKNLIVAGTALVDGKKLTIGGEMDLVVVTPSGELKIYDIKTGKKGIKASEGVKGKAGSWDFYGTDNDDYNKKAGYQLQLSLYTNMLENATGLKVNRDELKIVPFEVDIDLKGYIKTLELKDEEKNTSLKYDPLASEYIPLTTKGETATNVITGTTTAPVLTGTAAKEKTTEKSRDVRAALPITFEELQDQEVEWQGMTGTIKIYGPDNIVFETENMEYAIEDADLSRNPADFGFEGILTKEPFASTTEKKYDVTDVTEDAVTVNGVEYLINTNSLGNIESLSPVNEPEQKIKNEKLVTAVEIERNKLEYNTSQEIVDAVLELRGENYTGTVLEGIYATNFTPTIAEGLDKLYEGAPMTEQEKLQVEMWAFDALDRVMTLQDTEEYKKNEEVNNAVNNLRQIINTLHGEQSTKKQKGTTGAEETTVSKPAKKGKRTITKRSSKKQKAEVKKKESDLGPTIASSRPRTLAKPVITLESINANINLDNLKEAKSRKYEVIYEKVNYKIARVGKKSVTLSAPNLPNVKVDTEDFSKLRVVEQGGVKGTSEDNDTINDNAILIATSRPSVTKKPIADLRKNLFNAAKKC